MPEILSRPRRERIPPLQLEAETGLLWMWAGLSCFLSSGDGYIGELLELQQVLLTYDGDLWDPLWWLQERQSPCELHGTSWDSSPVDAGG